jgi:hypothetical protein
MAAVSADHELIDPSKGVKHPDAAVRDMWLRRILIAIVAVIVLVGLTGRLGVRSNTLTQRAQSGDMRVELTYAEVARPGLAVPWRLAVTGLDAASPHLVEVELTAGYADSFDFNNLTPDPDSISRTPTTITYEFQVEDSAELQMAFDTRVEPAVQSRRTATVSVAVDGEPVAEFDFTTWILP